MLARVFLWLYTAAAGKEVKAMLVRLYAGEIILEKITIEDVPPKLRTKVAAYLEEMGMEA